MKVDDMLILMMRRTFQNYQRTKEPSTYYEGVLIFYEYLALISSFDFESEVDAGTYQL